MSADRIESELKERPTFNFNAYRVKVSESEFKDYVASDGLFKSKIDDPIFLNAFKIDKGILKFNIPRNKINSYHASFIATYLVQKLLDTSQSFCFETVMSNIAKIALLKKAQQAGYKTYLYFIFTDNVNLNITRVKLRTKLGKHDVPVDLIKSRYPRTFELLPHALKFSDEAYIIDNSNQPILAAEKTKNVLKVHKSASLFIKGYLK